jgi:hypothetical protein
MAMIIYVWERGTLDIDDLSHVIINKPKVVLSQTDDLSHVIINKTKVPLSQT